MKKIIIVLFVTVNLSFIFGSYIVLAYKNSIVKDIKPTNVYMMLYGSYNNKDNADKVLLDNYIMTYENGFYKVYVGATLNIDNANTLKKIYESSNKEAYIVEKELSCTKFIDYLYNNDSYTNMSNKEILFLQNDIINKYKEGCL